MPYYPQPEYPQRIDLAATPTPLQPMERLSRQLGTEIWFKRDDITGSELSGNKIRKLEFLMAEALRDGHDVVLTCGGAQSNHCRATALAAARCGLQSLLLLRTPDPQNPPRADGNILLDRLAGAEIVWITPDQYRDREQIFRREVQRLAEAGRKPYVIPEGGSNDLGAWGYIRALDELATQLAEVDGGRIKPTTVISATGSGGTTAGLILGNRLMELNLRIVGVNVCDDAAYFQREIGEIGSQFVLRYGGVAPLSADDIEILDGYVGRGYALSRPQELAAIRDLVRLEGVVLDPVYTGKAYFGMRSALEQDATTFGTRIVFIHTGGLFGLFPIADLMAAEL